jgi:hypothetical protein
MFIDPNKKYLENMWNELYIEMLANPDDNRTDKQFLDDIGIAKDTLWRWKCKHRLQIYEEVSKRRNQYIQNIRNILQRALIKKVEAGDTNAIKLGFQVIGDLVEKNVHQFDGMERTDKEKRILSLFTEIDKKRQAWESAANQKPSNELGSGPSNSTPDTGKPE